MPQNKDFGEALDLLHQILSKTELTESIKWGVPVFTYGGKNVVGYVSMKEHFALWFYNGVFLSDPYRILINAQEGKTKAMRQWRFTSIGEIDEAKILKYVQEAIENEKAGKAWKPEKSAAMEIPDILQQRLDTEAELRAAFEKLTPFKQREFVEYITEAKREATQLSRLEKIIPLILQGIGLNDKYR
jgi:uncharacterized protein YdeI (YjbR/CyaY-like superfamily)